MKIFVVMSNKKSLVEQLNKKEDSALTSNSEKIKQKQESIYQFFLKSVQHSSPESVLENFNHLFIFAESSSSPEILSCVYEIIFSKNETEFFHTLKRVSYILVNNWYLNREYKAIDKLVRILGNVKTMSRPLSRSRNQLRTWLLHFIDSEDYQELKIFAAYCNGHNQNKWSQRYTAHLLVPQYLDYNNPQEQREVARNLALKLKQRFKFALVKYTAHFNAPQLKHQYAPANPTKLGEGAIRLIHQVLDHHLVFNYENYAHIFLQQVNGLSYQEFKQSLKKYLLLKVNNYHCSASINRSTEQIIDGLYTDHNHKQFKFDLLLRTSRKIINYLTTEDGQKPSAIFTSLMIQNSFLSLVVTLLKIVLICPDVHSHIEIVIAQLIRYHEKLPESQCQSFINFLEVFDIVFALYTENVQYSLVQIQDETLATKHLISLEKNRIFSQIKGTQLQGINLSGSDLKAADFSLAKLSKANLSNTCLEASKLILTDLQEANLSYAQLKSADLRRADLRQANLAHGNLSAAKLCHANLRHANLQAAQLTSANFQGANLGSVNLQGAHLRYADLRYVNLDYANLRSADLSYADLRGSTLHHADLTGAVVRHAQVNRADLSYANFCEADLSHTNLNQSNLHSANFNYACARHVNFCGADLRDVTFEHSNLFGSKLDQKLNQVKV